MGIPSNTLLTEYKFIGRISTMGEKKMVIYVPIEFHKDMSKHFKGKPLLISVTEAIKND